MEKLFAMTLIKLVQRITTHIVLKNLQTKIIQSWPSNCIRSFHSNVPFRTGYRRMTLVKRSAGLSVQMDLPMPPPPPPPPEERKDACYMEGYSYLLCEATGVSSLKQPRPQIPTHPHTIAIWQHSLQAF